MTTQEINAIKVIENYVDLKRTEKDAQGAVKNLQTAFKAACEASDNGSSQIQLADGTVIFKRFSQEFQYSDEINQLEDELEARKEEYRKANEASAVRSTWVVKL